MANYSLSFNVTNIGKIYFDHEPNRDGRTYFSVCKDVYSGSIIYGKTDTYEDSERKSYRASLSVGFGRATADEDAFNGFEITYYPVD